MTARVMTRLTLKTVTPIDYMQHVYFIWTSILYLRLKIKQQPTTKIRQMNTVIFYFQTKY